TMGADPIAAAVAYHSARTARPVSWFSVRKTAKEHGARRWLEGSVTAGDRVALVEDVITSGGSLVDALRKCGEEDLHVLAAGGPVGRFPCSPYARPRRRTARGAGSRDRLPPATGARSWRT